MAFDPAQPLDAVFDVFGVAATFQLSTGEATAVRAIVRLPDVMVESFVSRVVVPSRQVEIRAADLVDLPRAPQAGDVLTVDGSAHTVINTPERRDSLSMVWTLDLR